MKTHDELIDELYKCTVELEDIRKEEQQLMSKFSSSPATAGQPPARMTKELLGKIHDVHERQIAVMNERKEILHELHELHEELHAPEAVKEEQVIEELLAELEKCTVELDEIRKKEEQLMPRYPDSSTTAGMPPAIMTKELVGKINEIHKRQITLSNKRSDILKKLHRVHERSHAPQAVKAEQSIEGLSKVQSQMVEEIFAEAPPQTRELFFNLHEQLIKLAEVEAVPGRWWIDYQKKGVTFMTLVTPDFERNSLGLFIKMGANQVNDPKGWTKKIDGPSELNTTFRLRSIEHIDYAMSLVRQAYNYTN